MHQGGASNWTDVVFGVLSDPMNVPINPVSLSLLRSSLIELFLQQSNLTLTSIFGQSSKFELLKFQGGITVIPLQSISIWQIQQVLFNFTLMNSISEIQDRLVQLKEQLRFGLHLRPYEVSHHYSSMLHISLMVPVVDSLMGFAIYKPGSLLNCTW